MKIILASQSPRRQQLLQWADVSFEVVVANTPEAVEPGLLPEQVAERIALEKAAAVAEKTGYTKPVLAADTIVVVDDEIIGKPANRAEAIATLLKLQGRSHQVVTGVAIILDQVVEPVLFADTTTVHFGDLTEKEAIYYVDKYQPFDKAGAYAIQEWIGVTAITGVEGCFYNVMGLPVSKVIAKLKELRVDYAV